MWNDEETFGVRIRIAIFGCLRVRIKDRGPVRGKILLEYWQLATTVSAHTFSLVVIILWIPECC